MQLIIDDFLEALTKTNVPQKEAILSICKEYENNPSIRVSSLDELENHPSPEKILHVEIFEEGVLELPHHLLKCKNLISLDLGNNPLQSLEGVERLTNLEFLFLNDCEFLRTIPSEIGTLKKLKGVDFSGTSITSLPKSFFTLSNLVFCQLENNKLDNSIFFELENLANLVHLDISRNEILNEDGIILVFKNLVTLDLSGNNFEVLPIDFSQCPLLEQLNTSYNPLTHLPDSIGALKNLRELEMRYCHIEYFPSYPNFLSVKILKLGYPEMKEIPQGVFNIKNLQELEIDEASIKTLPDEIGSLSSLEILSITNTQLRYLPESIGQLSNLKTLELVDNNLESLPATLGNLSNLISLSIADFNEGNRLKELPTEVCQLQNLVELDISYNKIENLPKKIGTLSNLQIFNISGNPLNSLPYEFADLRKLKALSIHRCPFDEMPEIKDMGINELFEYFNHLRGIGKYAFNWEIPPALRTAFQQYLLFFTDYLKKLEGYEVKLDVIKTPKGLKLITEATESLSIEKINHHLSEYLFYIQGEVEFTASKEVTDTTMELFRLRMEQQINHFKFQARQYQIENQFLKKALDTALQTNLNFSSTYQNRQAIAKTSDSNLYQQKICKTIRQHIIRNELEEAIEVLKSLLETAYPSRLNEVIALHSRFNRIKSQARIGRISFEQEEREMNQIISGLLEIINQL